MAYRKKRVTIVGSRGFIGNACATVAESLGLDVLAVSHDRVPVDRDLGAVLYCSGVAWGSEKRPVDTFEAHVGSVVHILRDATYDRFLYVSSTRVYDRSSSTSESSDLGVRMLPSPDIYTTSKIAGEAAVLSARSENRVVRLSNVFGESLRSELFLSDILRQAVSTGAIVLRSSLDSAKDYVGVADVAKTILRIADASGEQIYNVAAGYNTTHRALISAIRSEMDIDVRVPENAPVQIAAPIDVSSITREFAFEPHDVRAAIPSLLAAFRAAQA